MSSPHSLGQKLRTRRCSQNKTIDSFGLYLLFPLVQGFAQAAHDALLTQDNHGVEQRRSNGLANDRNAGCVDEQARLHAGVFGNFAGSVVTGIVIPFRENR